MTETISFSVSLSILIFLTSFLLYKSDSFRTCPSPIHIWWLGYLIFAIFIRTVCFGLNISDHPLGHDLIFVSACSLISLIFLFFWNILGTVFLLRVTLIMNDYRSCLHTPILILCWCWVIIFYLLVTFLCALGVMVFKNLFGVRNQQTSAQDRMKENLRSHYAFFLMDLEMYSLAQLKVEREDLNLFLAQHSHRAPDFPALKEEKALIKQNCASISQLKTIVNESNKTESIEMISFRSRKSSSKFSFPQSVFTYNNNKRFNDIKKRRHKLSFQEKETFLLKTKRRKNSCQLKEPLISQNIKIKESKNEDTKEIQSATPNPFVRQYQQEKTEFSANSSEKTSPNPYFTLSLLEELESPKIDSRNLILNSHRKMSLDESLDDCTICFASLLQRKGLIKLFCGHKFHTKCIFEWFNQKMCCPTCKVNVRIELIKALVEDLNDIIDKKECLFDELN